MVKQPQPAGILLAAGRGARFDASGRQSKLLQTLPDGRPLAVAAAQALLAATARVVAVVPDAQSANTLALREALQAAGCEVLPCAAASLGMGHSLAAAVAATRQSAGWLVMLADLPLVQAATCRRVADALQAGAVIAMPNYQGRNGHPVGFSIACLADLLLLSGDSGAKALLQRYPLTRLPCDDAGTVMDIDTPADWLALQRKGLAP